jgi:peroxiredoxin
MTIGKIHVTKNYFRKRLQEPSKFDPASFRTKTINEDTKIIVGCPKGAYCRTCSRRKKCNVGLQAQAILKKR